MEKTSTTAGFVHLHVHSHYSTLDGACKIPDLINKAIDCRMNALALTDHGTMFGIKEFVDLASSPKSFIEKDLKKARAKAGDKPSAADKKKIEKLEARLQFIDEHGFKPILGCEVYIAPQSRFDTKESKNDTTRPDGENLSKYNHLILLAKNRTGYFNLAKLVSLGFTEGYYYKPRIDKEILERYSEGLIVCSACIAGEIPQAILKGDLAKAEEAILWYKRVFGDDFYLELQRHKTLKPGTAMDCFPNQEKVNPVLLEMGKKHQIKCIATNDVHFLNEEDADAHDLLLCISTASKFSDEKRMRYTQQEWFKTAEEMAAIFPDHLELLENTLEIAEKVEKYSISAPPQMPSFEIPADFVAEEIPAYFEAERVKQQLEKQGEKGRRENLYLRHLAYKGAKIRYGENLDATVRERIDFELETIAGMGFPGYFLIVQDFISAARSLGVAVGPGRGSAAGSVVAYCLKITDLDPFKYDLLFERFLNPDRISLPDIDIDFDEDGRARVLQWVTDKYGAEKVAHIVTYGTMAAKSAINDVARAFELTVGQSKALTKLFTKDTKSIADVLKVPEMQTAIENPENAKVMRFAEQLENTIRQTGVHACGVIIAPDAVSNFAPIATAKDKDTGETMLVTQFEGSRVEDVGLIKMDFLGLTTLSIIQDALAIIKERTGQEIDIDHIPLDDAKTFELFAAGETTGTFQFESAGMKKYLRELKPTCIDDLIAMNALYRPGPLQYIPDFIARKHGRQPITYDLPEMEGRLKDTYGITVYQEQVMLLSRDLAGFTRGQSDELRKAMGKKLIDKLNALELKFVEGCKKNGHTDEKIISKIWNDWKAFASYAFNKSHAACYSWLAYQTAYLKAHFPSEYMAAAIHRAKPEQVPILLADCARMKIKLLLPDLNESSIHFSVNADGHIRYGLETINGVGKVAAEAIVQERKNRGNYKDIYDFFARQNLKTCNKRVAEALAEAGAFDTLTNPESRPLFFAKTKTNPKDSNETFIDALLKYGASMQSMNSSAQLFGASNQNALVNPPKFPALSQDELPSRQELLKKEFSRVKMYISGHPMDQNLIAVHKARTNCDDMELLSTRENAKFSLAVTVSDAKTRISKKGAPFMDFTVEDINGSKFNFRLFSKDFEKFSPIIQQDAMIFIKGEFRKRNWGDGGIEAAIISIDPLEIHQKSVNFFNIDISSSSISQEFVEQLNFVFSDNLGNYPVKIKINSSSDSLTMIPSVGVNLSRKFFLALDELNTNTNSQSSTSLEIDQDAENDTENPTDSDDNSEERDEKTKLFSYFVE